MKNLDRIRWVCAVLLSVYLLFNQMMSRGDGIRAIGLDRQTYYLKVEAENDFELSPVEKIVREEFSVQREGINLYGVITASENYRAEKRTLLIISHGFGNVLEDYEVYATYLAKLGFLVYSFDFYGGESCE